MTTQDHEILQENTEAIQEKIEGANELAELKSQILELQDRLLRASAETENTRRRYEKQIEETREYSITGLCRDLIPVMDNISSALAHKPATLSADMQNIVDGIEMTKTGFINVFTKYGIEAVVPVEGDKFDYNLHHAISQIPINDHPQGTILQLMQIGYKIKDRLLRPAAVSVAKKAD
ncbi:MAG: nucleotide exchange factor GrpE [Pseudomonadota bacterium]